MNPSIPDTLDFVLHSKSRLGSKKEYGFNERLYCSSESQRRKKTKPNRGHVLEACWRCASRS